MGARIEDFVKATVTVTSGTNITFNPNSVAILTSEQPLNYTDDYMLTTRREQQVNDAFGSNSHVAKVFKAIAEQSPSALDYNGDVTIVSANVGSGEVPQTIYSGLLDGRNRDGWKKGTLSFNFTKSGVESYNIDLSKAKDYSDVADAIETALRSGEVEEDAATVYLTSVDSIDDVLTGNEYFIAASGKLKTNDPEFTFTALDEDWTITVDGTDIDISLPKADAITNIDKLSAAISKAFKTDGRGFTVDTDVNGYGIAITYPTGIDASTTPMTLTATPKASGKTSIFTLVLRAGMKAEITITPKSKTGATTILPKAGDTPFSIISDIASNLPSGFAADLKTDEVEITSTESFTITIATTFHTGDTTTTPITSVQTSVGATAVPTAQVTFEDQRLQFVFSSNDEVSQGGIAGTLAPTLSLEKDVIYQASYTKSRETLAEMLTRLNNTKSVAGVCIAVPETDGMRKNTNIFIKELMGCLFQLEIISWYT